MIEKTVLFHFLEESFPGMEANIARCEPMGFPWKSRPFLKEEKGEIVSHVGLLEYLMWIEGKWHKAGALHAICTKKDCRGQGLASELVRETLKWCQNRYTFVILFTEIDSFYEKLGFTSVQEYRFRMVCKKGKGTLPLYPLVSPKDDVLLQKCFQNRHPLSNRLWVKDDGTIASYNTLFATYPVFWSLHYSPSIDGILSFTLENKTLHLFDVIAHRIPSLDTILDHLPEEIEEIFFYFSPDRLTDAAAAEPLSYDKKTMDFSGFLMVHGNWPSVRPFMIPPLSRC